MYCYWSLVSEWISRQEYADIVVKLRTNNDLESFDQSPFKVRLSRRSLNVTDLFSPLVRERAKQDYTNNSIDSLPTDEDLVNQSLFNARKSRGIFSVTD